MPQRQARWVRPAVIVLCGLSVIGLLMATMGALRPTSSDQPDECTGSAGAAQSDACKEARLSRALDQADPASLHGLDEQKRIEVARALCKEGSALADDTGVRPLRSIVFGQAAQSQGVSIEVINAIVDHLNAICPDAATQIRSLPTSTGSVAAVLSVDGSGPVTVTYTDSNGTETSEAGFAPWSLPIRLAEPTDVHVSAASRKVEDAGGATGLRCAITVEGSAVSKDEATSKHGSVSCSARAQDLIHPSG